jgi:hypothetical protein
MRFIGGLSVSEAETMEGVTARVSIGDVFEDVLMFSAGCGLGKRLFPIAS